MYEFYRMNPEGFQKVVLLVCCELLGDAATAPPPGPDGGVDVYFEGTAQAYPSTSNPWSGKIVVQVKHSDNPYSSYSDQAFLTSVLRPEIKKIKKLKQKGRLDYYMLVSNRRMTYTAEEKIKTLIHNDCNIPLENIRIISDEQLNRWCTKYRLILEDIHVYPVSNAPLNISPEELSAVIEAIVDKIGNVSTGKKIEVIQRISYDEKNRINEVPEEYVKTMNRLYLPHQKMISDFLAHPANETIREKYISAAQELQELYIIHTKKGEKFMELIRWFATYLFERDAVLKAQKAWTRTILYFMYFSCDLGYTEYDSVK